MRRVPIVFVSAPPHLGRHSLAAQAKARRMVSPAASLGLGLGVSAAIRAAREHEERTARARAEAAR